MITVEPSDNRGRVVSSLTAQLESGGIIYKLPWKNCEKEKKHFFAAQDLENMNLQEKFETIGTLTLKKRKLRLNLTVFSYGETATRRKEIIFSVSVEDRTRSDGHKFSNREFS